LAAALAGGCRAGDGGATDAWLVHDPCQALTLALESGTAPERAAAVSDGAGMWNELAHTRLSVAVADGGPGEPTATDPDDPERPSIPILFQRAAAPSHGLYDPRRGVILLNAGFTDPRALAITLAHEVGHAFGLRHVDPADRASVMNPGNLALPPTEEDARALAELWGTCPR
jgi:hypothetical protein